MGAIKELNFYLLNLLLKKLLKKLNYVGANLLNLLHFATVKLAKNYLTPVNDIKF